MDCGLAAGAYRHIWDIGFIERVKRRTNGQVQFEVTSFSELGVSGANSLRLIEDGTLSAAQVYPPYIRGAHEPLIPADTTQGYPRYIRGDYLVLDVSGLWGLHPDQATNLAVIDAALAGNVRTDRGQAAACRSPT